MFEVLFLGPHYGTMSHFLGFLRVLILDLFLKDCDNVTLIGNFNLSSDDVPLESFLQAYNLTSLIKEATCFQSSNPSCIDLILTNQKICINSLILLKLGYLITIN